MILDIDMGNTRGKWRLRTAGVIHQRGVLDIKVGVAAGLQDFYFKANLAEYKIEKILISSVLDEERNAQLSLFFKEKMAIVVCFAKSTASWNHLKNGYDHPEKLGVDRWLAMIAAVHENHGACIVVDCGTAITVDAIDAEGNHCGGYIAPGFGALHQALFNTTLIPPVQTAYSHSSAPGLNTAAAIENARLAMLSGLIVEAERALLATSNGSQPLLIATGGDAIQVQKNRPDALLKPELVLDGLALLFETSGQVEDYKER